VNSRGDKSPLFLFQYFDMISADKIRQIADVKLAEGSNYLVDVIVKPGNKINVLLDNDAGISIVDCIALSRYIESNLDRDIEDFELNVMSPGLTEPFKIARQYQKNIGKQVDLVTKDGKKMTGKLLSIKADQVELETRTKERGEKNKGKKLVVSIIKINLDQIKETKLVLSF